MSAFNDDHDMAPRPLNIPAKLVKFRGEPIGYAQTLGQAARIGRFHGADVDPVNANNGKHWIVQGPESFSIEARIAP